MKNNLRIIFTIGVISMFSLYGCSKVLKYKTYSSNDTQINIEIDYVSGWSYSESRGSGGSYAQVIFYEPRIKDKNFKAGIVLTVQDSSKVKLDSLNVKSFADALLAKRQNLKDMKLLSRSENETLGLDAANIELAYRILDKLNMVDAKLIPAKEKIVILERNGKFYTLRYINTDAEFIKFDEAFSHIIKTLRFKDNK